MKAAFFNTYGPANVLQYGDFKDPEASASQCKIRVLCASVNPVDWKIRGGYLKWILPIKRPYIPGFDICGEVVQIGSAVTQFRKGDIVFGSPPPLKGGGYAEFICVDEKQLAQKPKNCTPQEAACLPVAGLTAWHGLFNQAKINKGSRVLILGGSGGVGHFAVQLAKQADAYVIASCSGRNMDFVKGLGADEVIDYTKTDPLKSAHSFDVVFDTIPTSSFAAARHVLTENGCYLSPLPSLPLIGELMKSWFRQQKAYLTNMSRSQEDMQAFAKVIESKNVKPFLEKMFSLSEARAAQEYSESGRVRGKIALHISAT